MSDLAPDLEQDELEQRLRLSGGILSWEIEDLLQAFPQRAPFLLLDRVLSLIPGNHAVAIKRVTGHEGGFASHRHGFVFPSTFAVEALGQLAQLLASGLTLPSERKPADPWPRVVAVDDLVVHQELLAPGSLHLSASRFAGGPPTEDPRHRVFVGEVTLASGPYLQARLTLDPTPAE